MEDADDDEKRKAFPNFMRRYEQNITDKHLLDLFVSFRRAAEEQHRRRCRNHIGNADNRFLRNLARPFSRYRKNGRSNQSEPERDAESCPALKIEMKQNGETNPERRHLRHSDVDENDSTLNNVQAEVNKKPRQ